MKLLLVTAITILSLFFYYNKVYAANYAEIVNNIKTTTTGSNSNVNVNIKNNLNTQSSTSTSKSTSTKVDISQEGEGTSQVVINGKEWKLEGPGEINVNETNDNVANSKKDSVNTPTLSLTEEDLSKQTEDQLSDEVEYITQEIEQSFLQKIRKFFHLIYSSLLSF